MSKASKDLVWYDNQFVDMRMYNAYIDTMASLSSALSHENVDWLLSNVAGWDVVLNTPIECKQSTQERNKGAIVRESDLWNRAAKARWQADPTVYRHIHTKAYVEHPYEKQPTKDFIVEGVLEARKRGLTSSAIATQVAEIIDARLDCVLVPADPREKVSQPHPDIKDLIGSKKDGMVQKYSLIPLVDHETQAKLTLEDIQRADDDMRRRVESAMTTLTGKIWTLPNRSVAVKRKLRVTNTQPKTSKPATTLPKPQPQVREADLRAAMFALEIDPDRPTNPDGDPSQGYSYRSVRGGRNLLLGVKFVGLGGFSSGRFATLDGEPKFRDLTVEQFKEHVERVVQDRRNGVY